MSKRVLSIVMIVVLLAGATACSTNIDNGDVPQNGDNVVGEKDNEKDHGNGKDDKSDTEIEYELTEEGIIKPEFAKKIIEEISDKLIYAISVKDFDEVSKFVHPVKGVRFTPYTSVSPEQDVVFDQRETENFFNSQNTYLWGYYDGRGNEILLTPSQYYDEFIYTQDFVNAEDIGYNKVLGGGNAIENQFEVYDNAIVVEYYFSGFNPEYAGMDWKSLRLVFEQHEDDWKLVGIIHNQWTI